MDSNSPIHRERCGNITVSIWENVGEDKQPYYTYSLPVKRYQQDGEWKTATTLQRRRMENSHDLATQRHPECRQSDGQGAYVGRKRSGPGKGKFTRGAGETAATVYAAGRKPRTAAWKGIRLASTNTGSIFRLLDDGGKKTSVIAAVAFGIGYWIGKNEKYKGYDRQHHESKQHPDKHTEREHDRHKHGDSHHER